MTLTVVDASSVGDRPSVGHSGAEDGFRRVATASSLWYVAAPTLVPAGTTEPSENLKSFFVTRAIPTRHLSVNKTIGFDADSRTGSGTNMSL